MSRVPLVALAALVVLSACSSSTSTSAQASTEAPVSSPESPKNVILFIADGFGPASATLGAAASEALGRPWALGTGLTGSVETSPTDSGRVTDSAAGATAYACGIKTYNGAIAMRPDGESCRTVLEDAEARGMATGLVATSRITHATPASFAAHVPQRSMEAEIAAQLTASGVEVMFGGGRPNFTERADGRDLVAELRQSGATVALDGAGFEALASTPAVALLADSHLAYEVDREATDEPSLSEMTTKALDLLAEAGGDEGFFLMVEASRIDHAGHGNDPVGHLHDILAYDEAVAVALAWAEAEGNTLVVATSDHETGGMTLGRDGVYFYDPVPVLNATMSREALSRAIVGGADPVETFQEGLAIELEEGVAEAIRGAVAAEDSRAIQELFVSLSSEPAGIGWTTGGHTAVDVGLYAWGPGSDLFVGQMGNDEVGRRLFRVLGFPVPEPAE
ncbi:MAG: alkaline phosphatase [Bacteroidota bacterium]